MSRPDFQSEIRRSTEEKLRSSMTKTQFSQPFAQNLAFFTKLIHIQRTHEAKIKCLFVCLFESRGSVLSFDAL